MNITQRRKDAKGERDQKSEVRSQNLCVFAPWRAILLCLAVVFCSGCSSRSLVTNRLARETVAAVAKYYGGSQAGELAAAGLSATADVMQGYVDKRPPLQVAANSPGVQGVSQIVVNYLQSKGWITQGTVDTIHAAAQIAANATVSTVNEGP
jgi:hypothetical protein